MNPLGQPLSRMFYGHCWLEVICEKGGKGADGVFRELETCVPTRGRWHELEPLPVAVRGVTGSVFVLVCIHPRALFRQAEEVESWRNSSKTIAIRSADIEQERREKREIRWLGLLCLLLFIFSPPVRVTGFAG